MDKHCASIPSNKKMIDLSNKNILVTGASSGIGQGIATQLSQLGARLALQGNKNIKDAEHLASKSAEGSRAFQADLSQSMEVNRLAVDVLQDFGHIDVLINNAGIAVASAIDEDHSTWLESWNKTMAINLTAAGLLSKHFLPHFIKNNSGIIINISSRAAFRGDTADYMAYAASKAGLVSLTKSIARAFGHQGITAFTIAPGFTKTAMAQDFIDRYGTDIVSKDIALDRLTEPKDIAPTVAFLASGLAAHATGTTIDINAGSYMR